MTDDQLRKALSLAWNMGQTYWQQADSEYASQHRKSDETRNKYLALVEETCAALVAAPVVPTPEPYAYEVTNAAGDQELMYAAYLARYATEEEREYPRAPLYLEPQP